MKLMRSAVAAAAVAALAVPAAASGHPSVYTDEARVDLNPAQGAFTEGFQDRHMVTNHGYTYVLRETNGTATGGVIDYSRMPGDFRAGFSFAQIVTNGDTAAQAHATCRGVPALASEAAITGWQDGDPFYNYVPFQKASAGLEDDPAEWIPVVLAETGIDLTQIADNAPQALVELETACEGLGGGATFVPADQMQTSAAALSSGVAAPLQQSIATLQGEKAAALQSASAADAAAKAATARALAAEQSLAVERTAVTVQLADTRIAARRGVGVELTGPPAREVIVRLLIPSSRAKALGLRRNVVGAAVTMLNAEGTGSTTVEVFRTARRALRRAGTSVPLSVTAAPNDLGDTASATLTR